MDWLEAACWYLSGTAEREHEDSAGPIHSYSMRLRGWDSRMWDHAWVNRIALWLRAWAEHEDPAAAGRMGELPEPEVLLSHDVDAITKTLATRVKQSAFHSLNAARHLLRLEAGLAGARIARAATFAVGQSDYWRIPEMTRLEEERGWRSTFFVFGGPAAAGRTMKLRLMDPSYEPAAAPLGEELTRLVEGGWEVGLHPSFDTWADPTRYRRELDAVSGAAGLAVDTCRQHWLRFSWSDTWRAQADIGIRLDTTLGFNDRPGFRNGAAVAFRPLGSEGPVSLPLVVMDSHLHDYRPMSDEERDAELDRWLGEIREVRGQGSLVWHQRVLSPDYGWDYTQLLDAVGRAGLRVIGSTEPTVAL